MRKISITDNSIHRDINIPDSWDELKLHQLIEIEKTNDIVQWFSILVGFDYSSLNDSMNPEVEWQIRRMVDFITKPPVWAEIKRPSKLLIGDKVYEPPRPDKVCLGQNILLTEIMELENITEVVPKALAIYFQPIVDGGKFNRERVPVIEDMLKNSPALDAYTTAAFFLKRPENLQRFMLNEQRLKGQTQQPA